MARQWERAALQMTCNRCGGPIAQDAPTQRVLLPHVTRRISWCVSCADGPPPTDLPSRVSVIEPSRLDALASVSQLAMTFQRDWKTRQAEPDTVEVDDAGLSQADADALAAAYQAQPGDDRHADDDEPPF